MISIRGDLISLLTFPGLILRQAIHAMCCRVLGVRVLDIRFFRKNTPSAYVLHELPKDFRTSLMLVLGPLVMHSLLCLVVCLPALVPFRYYEDGFGSQEVFQVWLGLSIGIHAFPTWRDADNLWDLTRQEARGRGIAVRLTLPILLFLRLARRLSNYGFDLAYATLIGIGIPLAILSRIFPNL